MRKLNQLENDWRTFKGISIEDRAKIMYLYLVDGKSMGDVAKIHYDADND